MINTVARGKLRIYLGAAPGVGKTYAMLGEGHRRMARGSDVVVAVVQTHGRPHTAQLIAGLEVIPRRVVNYRDSSFEEMDVDAVLARKPRTTLVDELAHTNVPGSRNEKRWQDVEELLGAGINVVSTVNVQHLESLGDVVESITGVRQRETVPDSVVRSADQLELVDMSPQALRRRMAHGNVYPAEKVDAALSKYFRVGNLTALRELALLWVADRVEEGLERYRAEHQIADIWPARERIVVALTGGAEGDTLIRRGARIADGSQGRDMLAVHVVRGDGTVGAAPDSLARQRALVGSMGGTFHTVVGDNVAEAVLGFAREVNATQIVLGASRRSRLRSVVQPGTSDAIVRESGDIDIHVVTHEKAGGRLWTPRLRRSFGRRRTAVAWAVAVLVPIILTIALHPFRGDISLVTVILTYLLGVVLSALIGGLAPAAFTAVIAGGLANWYFTPPYGSLTIAQPENAFALVVFVVVAAVIANIVDRSATRAQQAAQRGAEVAVFESLIAGVLRREDGVKALLEQARETFGMRLASLVELPAQDLPGAARWTVIESSGVPPLCRPDEADVVIDAGPSLLLVLAGPPLSTSDRRLLAAFAAQAASVLERSRLAGRAADAQRLQETDAMRSALLAAVSHDLRTPLAAIKLAVSSLREPSVTWSPSDEADLLATVESSADRLDGLLANLLDLSRLQAGAMAPVLRATSVEEVVSGAMIGVPRDRVVDDIPESLPLIMTDRGLLERVLANIVENAVRFAPPDLPVRVFADYVAAGDYVELRIVDRGVGVGEEDRERMFAAFQRLGDAPAGSGIGLGLAVARGLSEVIKARLSVEDTPGGGLTMVVALPVAGPDQDSDVRM
jgi:two-component system sensor histidine kinase KdpD